MLHWLHSFISYSMEWKIIKIEIENPGNNTRPHDFSIAAAPGNKVFYAAKAIKNLYADVVLMCSVLRQGLMLILLHMVLMPFHPKIPLKTFFCDIYGLSKKRMLNLFVTKRHIHTHTTSKCLAFTKINTCFPLQHSQWKQQQKMFAFSPHLVF